MKALMISAILLSLACNPANAGERGQLWNHLRTAADLGKSRGLSASLHERGGLRILSLETTKNHKQYSAWATISSPKEGWELGLKKSVECTVRNTGPRDVVVALWVVSSHGWDAVGDDVVLKPEVSDTLSCDLRETYPDGTPKLDPGRIREIRIMMQRAGSGASIDVEELIAAGSVEPWVRPANRLDVPEMETGKPAPGRRVRYQLPSDGGTSIYGTLYLPPDWERGKRYPVIAEYPGNIFYRARGCWSTGRPEQCTMGYGISSGEGAIWVSLPFVDRKSGDIAENGFGSNDGRDTRDHAMATMEDICANWGGDRENLFICGFSRGSIACGYIGLADDEIAPLWKGIVGCQHYDGSRWHQSNIEGGVKRAPRFKGGAIFQVDNSRKQYGPVQEATDPKVEWTWRESGLGYHATAMFLDDRPLMKELRKWFRELTIEQ